MIRDIRITIPEKGQAIIDTIRNAGFEAYVVGGCVRDSLLGRKPEDWDITTSARPEQVKELFSRTIDTGLQHGTVTVMMGGEGFEVTTYRIDGEYEDSRHPSEVIFTPELEEDLRRRDLTINAMAYNEEEGLVDKFGGMEDLKAGIVRCVGRPEERFQAGVCDGAVFYVVQGGQFFAYPIDCAEGMAGLFFQLPLSEGFSRFCQRFQYIKLFSCQF